MQELSILSSVTVHQPTEIILISRGETSVKPEDVLHRDLTIQDTRQTLGLFLNVNHKIVLLKHAFEFSFVSITRAWLRGQLSVMVS